MDLHHQWCPVAETARCAVRKRSRSVALRLDSLFAVHRRLDLKFQRLMFDDRGHAGSPESSLKSPRSNVQPPFYKHSVTADQLQRLVLRSDEETSSTGGGIGILLCNGCRIDRIAADWSHPWRTNR